MEKDEKTHFVSHQPECPHCKINSSLTERITTAYHFFLSGINSYGLPYITQGLNYESWAKDGKTGE